MLNTETEALFYLPPVGVGLTPGGSKAVLRGRGDRVTPGWEGLVSSTVSPTIFHGLFQLLPEMCSHRVPLAAVALCSHIKHREVCYNCMSQHTDQLKVWLCRLPVIETSLWVMIRRGLCCLQHREADSRDPIHNPSACLLFFMVCVRVQSN